MPVFQLTEALRFPPCHYAEPDGLLAVGGDLSSQRLLLAYRLGIFPWYSDDMPILWWSPDPRLVLFPAEMKTSRSLRRTVKKGRFQVTCDRAFDQVIVQCGELRELRGEGTWLTSEMIEAYCGLHRKGHAHSVESWLDGELVGGLYGVSLGRVFFGESMFSLVSDASKVAFVHLVQWVTEWGYELIDCQVATAHLKRFGAREIPRPIFLTLVRQGVETPPPPSAWNCFQGETHHD
jgi:leucyl/phenylalanyl-tRNA---protein transferase